VKVPAHPVARIKDKVARIRKSNFKIGVFMRLLYRKIQEGEGKELEGASGRGGEGEKTPDAEGRRG